MLFTGVEMGRSALVFYVVFAGVLALIAGLRWTIGFDGLYGQDSHEYYRYAGEVQAFFLGGERPGPFFWPVGYPLAIALLGVLGVEPGVAGQCLSALGLAGAFLFMRRTLCSLPNSIPAAATVYPLLCVVSAPYVLRSGVLVMSDALCLGAMAGAVYFCTRLCREYQTRWFVAGWLWAGVAVAIRFPSMVMLVVPLGVAVFLALKTGRWRDLFLGLLVFGVCWIPHVFFRAGGMLEFLDHGLLSGWSPLNWFAASFDGVDGLRSYRFPNLVFCFSTLFHPGFGVVFPVLLFFVRWADFRRKEVWGCLFGFLCTVAFLAGLPFQNSRVLMPTVILLLPVLYPAFLRVWGRVSNQRTIGFLTGLILVTQGALFALSFRRVVVENQTERTIAARLHALPPRPLYTFAMDPALRSRQVPNEVRSIFTHRYTHFESGAYFLFNEQRYGLQFENGNPGQNWKALQSDYQLIGVERFEQGWLLVEIGPPKP